MCREKEDQNTRDILCKWKGVCGGALLSCSWLEAQVSWDYKISHQDICHVVSAQIYKNKRFRQPCPRHIDTISQYKLRFIFLRYGWWAMTGDTLHAPAGQRNCNVFRFSKWPRCCRLISCLSWLFVYSSIYYCYLIQQCTKHLDFHWCFVCSKLTITRGMRFESFIAMPLI